MEVRPLPWWPFYAFGSGVVVSFFTYDVSGQFPSPYASTLFLFLLVSSWAVLSRPCYVQYLTDGVDAATDRGCYTNVKSTADGHGLDSTWRGDAFSIPINMIHWTMLLLGGHLPR